MADEVIVLDVDETEAVRGAQRANRALELVEKTGERASQSATQAATSQSDRVVRIVERSRQSVERLVASAERKAEFAGKTGVQRLEAGRDLLLRRIGGDERAINRVKAAYATLIAAESGGGSRLGGVLSAIKNPIEAAGNGLEGLAEKMGKVGVIAASVGVGLGVAGVAAFNLVKTSSETAEQVSNLGDRLGITARQAYVLKIQAESSGLGVGNLEAAYRKLSSAIEGGSEEGKRGAEALARLGVRVVEVDGRVRNVSDLFGDVGAALGGIQNPADRARRAIAIFGEDGGLALLPLLTAFNDTKAAAERASVGIDDSLLRSLAKTDDQIDEILAKLRALAERAARRIVVAVDFLTSIPDNPLAVARGRAGDGRLSAQELRPRAAGAFGRRLFDEADAGVGSGIIDRFRRQRGATDEGLREALSRATRDRAAAEAKLTPGIGAAEAGRRVAEIQKLTAEESRLKNAIEARADAQRKAEQFAKDSQRVSESFPKALDESLRRSTDLGRDRDRRLLEFNGERLRELMDFQAETVKIREAATSGRASIELATIETTRARTIAALEASGAETVAQKTSVEQRKLAIEEESLIKSARIKANQLDEEARREIAQAEFIAQLRGLSEEEIGARRTAILEQFGDRARELEIRTISDVEQLKIESEGRITEMRIAEQRRVYEENRRSFESLLDQLFSRSRSWSDKLNALLSAAILTPIKRAASDAYATAVSGGGGGSSSGGGLFGGIFGRIMGGAGGGLSGLSGAPGGTSGFAGPVGGVGSAGRMNLGGIAAGQLAGFAGLKNLIGLGATSAGGSLTLGAAATFSDKLGAIGKSNAALAAGGLLAMDGLRRGGALGLAETTGGGALIGFRFGGPLGAAIGAGAGAIAGTIRLFVKGAEEKIVQRAKSIYGVTLDRRYARDPILGIIKSQFGGNIDAGLRSPQVRDLIELYGMSTGQGSGPLGDRIRPLSFSDSGRSTLTENAGYFNGSARLTLPSVSATPAPVVIESVQLVVGGESASAFFQGEAAANITANPGAVSTALQKATRLSIGRRDLLAAQAGMVTA